MFSPVDRLHNTWRQLADSFDELNDAFPVGELKALLSKRAQQLRHGADRELFLHTYFPSALSESSSDKLSTAAGSAVRSVNVSISEHAPTGVRPRHFVIGLESPRVGYSLSQKRKPSG